MIIRFKNSGANSNNNIIIESDIIITTVISINSILILSLLVTSSSVDISIAAAVQSDATICEEMDTKPSRHRQSQDHSIRWITPTEMHC